MFLSYLMDQLCTVTCFQYFFSDTWLSSYSREHSFLLPIKKAQLKMSSPTVARLSQKTRNFLCRIQRSNIDLRCPSTPLTHLSEHTPTTRRNVSKKQLFPPSSKKLNGQITFETHVHFDTKTKTARSLQMAPVKQAQSKSLLEESPNIGYEISSPFLRLLCQRSQPSDVLLLGRGTFGSVYFGLEKGERRALKVAEKGYLTGETNALNLCHPNIASVLWLWSACGDGTTTVAVMQYAGSLNLHTLLLIQDFVLSEQAKNSVCVQLAQALDYCHKRCLVHLDVKPANILISVSTGTCKLADFGCSLLLTELTYKKKDSARMQCSKRCSMVGTVAYVAPELFHGEDPTTAADIYSLGIVLYQLETKQTPFEGLHPHTLIYRVVSMKERPSIPSSYSNHKGYWQIVNACWHPEPKKRPKAKDILIKTAMIAT